ncbi:molybdopterin-binding oxidoreductase, partial [Streptomyces nojiriensis]
MESDPSRSARPRRAMGAVSGIVAAVAGLAAAQLAAAAGRPEASPVTAVGGAVVDLTPVAVREWAIRLFGTSDKLVLGLGILVALTAVAVGTGLLAVRHLPAAIAVTGGFGLVGALAALSRPDASWQDALPSLVGALVSAGVLYLLVRAGWRTRPAGASQGGGGSMDRRRFGRLVVAVLAASAGVGLGARRLG